MKHQIKNIARFSLVIGLGVALSGCNFFNRIANVGSEPPLSKIENPVAQKDYQPVSMPMPRPEPVLQQANSLWRPGSKAFFKDQRANQVGDIVTVLVEIEDKATLNNSTDTTRASSENAGFAGLLGLESQVEKILPEGTSAEALIDLGSDHSVKGSGAVNRNETINMEIAAIVTQILPNGNMVIVGRQEVRVNFESRDLSVTGVVRPEDITSSNTIESAKIAEARIAYGGRGHLTDVQQGRYGQQLFDIIFPF
ncbi:flagellar basal body L-ring protein FlgH [Sneathiella litorea]|uniref:Flagellar L-ring protein n=1 Tax=Sneathiella litorea TaxID=2606216 RepID=A0A6L8W6P0_9PROT|nr:flagellar basal body L-ring protein FlgH [Sneathiella litorea]MZR30806.1 flagellar basal body L-ring protein FlgH [Sneathiella litorea]